MWRYMFRTWTRATLGTSFTLVGLAVVEFMNKSWPICVIRLTKFLLKALEGI